jgi:hypothetical protein
MRVFQFRRKKPHATSSISSFPLNKSQKFPSQEYLTLSGCGRITGNTETITDGSAGRLFRLPFAHHARGGPASSIQGSRSGSPSH